MPIAIYALALAAFAIGTAEFVISGILPPLATDLGVSIPTAGLLVSAYAVGVAIGGPLLTLFTARHDQKTVLIVVMSVFAFAQVLCALAPDYGMLLLARLLSAAAHGVFFGAGNVVVARLVPPQRRGAALSLFVGGITISNLLGLPGGTAIGIAFGWRATFLAVGLFGAIAAIIVLMKLPAMQRPEHEAHGFRSQLRALRHQQVYLSYLTIMLTMIGALAFGTYQVAALLEVTGLDPGVVPLYLLLGGVGSVLGIYAGGRATDWKPMPSLLAILLLQALFYFTMTFALHDKVLVALNIFVAGFFGFAFSTPLQARVIHAARESPTLASSLVSTAFNLGIAAGAFLGALLLNAGFGVGQLPLIGAVTSLLAAFVAWLSWSFDRRVASGATALG